MKPIEFLQRPWAEIGGDFFQHNGKWYLLDVDYYSRDVKIAFHQMLIRLKLTWNLKLVCSRHGMEGSLYQKTSLTLRILKTFRTSLHLHVIHRATDKQNELHELWIIFIPSAKTNTWVYYHTKMLDWLVGSPKHNWASDGGWRLVCHAIQASCYHRPLNTALSREMRKLTENKSHWTIISVKSCWARFLRGAAQSLDPRYEERGNSNLSS